MILTTTDLPEVRLVTRACDPIGRVREAAVIACCLLLRWNGVSHAVLAPLLVGYLSHLGADLLTSPGVAAAAVLRRGIIDY